MLMPNQIKELESAHRQWNEHPITKHFLRMLKDQKERVVDILANNSITASDEQLRCYAVQLKTIETIKTLAHDTTTFIAKSNS